MSESLILKKKASDSPPNQDSFSSSNDLSLEARITKLENEVKSISSLIRQLGTCTFPAACRMLLKSGRISPSSLLPGKHDPLTSALIETLLVHGSLNLSQISGELWKETGKGDRKTIKARLVTLWSSGVASRESESGNWYLTSQFLEKWIHFISKLSKSSEALNDNKESVYSASESADA